MSQLAGLTSRTAHEMNLHEHIIGYDLRLPLPDLAKLWSVSRKQMFLYRDRVFPLSLDSRVWPKADVDQSSPVQSLFGNVAISVCGPDSEFREGFTIEVWPYIANLDQYLNAKFRGPLPGVLAKFTLALSAECDVTRRYTSGSMNLSSSTDAAISEFWSAGYDVVTCDAISCVSNLGNKELNQQGLLGHTVNDYHLFQSSARALEFAKQLDIIDSEHSPYLVVGVYLCGQKMRP